MFLSIRQLAAVGIASTLMATSACGGSEVEPAEPQPAQPDPPTVYALAYGPGPNWDAALPPEQQNLAEHIQYVGGLFGEGRLLANGFIPSQGRGLYLLSVSDASAVDAIVQADPGVTNGTLAKQDVQSWSLMMHALGKETQDDAQFFVLDYAPGPSWVSGKPLTEQPIGEHMAYVSGLFEQGALLAGGPLGPEAGRYLVTAADQGAAEGLVAADPAVKDELFSVTVSAWQVMQRQALR